MLLLDDLITSNSANIEDCKSLCRFLRSRLLFRSQKRTSEEIILDTVGDGSDCACNSDEYGREHIVCHPIYQILDRRFQEEGDLKSIDSELHEAVKLQLSQIIDGKLVVVENTVGSEKSSSSSRSPVRTEKDLFFQAYQDTRRNKKEKTMLKTKAQVLYEQYQRNRSRRKLVFKVHSELPSPFQVHLNLLDTPMDLYTKIDKILTKGCDGYDSSKRKIRIYRQEGSKRNEISFNSGTSSGGESRVDNGTASCNESQIVEDEDLLIDIGFKFPGANLFIQEETCP